MAKMVKCKSCNKEIASNAKNCPYCGARNKQPIYNQVWFWVVIFVVIVALLMSANSASEDSSSNPNKTTNVEDKGGSNSSSEQKEDKYSLDKPFKFDDLEITLGSQLSYTTVNNEFSEHNGKTVVKMPITVKNLKDENHSLNMFYYKVFGSQGTELDDVAAYFNEDSVDYAGDLRSGASYAKYLYFLYDGNGTYAMEFDNYSQKITIEFDINR